MQKGNRKISREKGVELVADALFLGTQTKEIVRNLTETYGVSKSTVEKWMTAARPTVDKRLAEAEAIRRREQEAVIAESAKKLHITKERVLEELAKIAFFDIRKAYNVDSGLKSIHELDEDVAAVMAGIESYDVKEPESGMVLGTTQKVKLLNKLTALEAICKIMGYNAPVEARHTGRDGGPIQTETNATVLIMPSNGREVKNAGN
ncbi:terminase small subunit [Deminuibacter soli]|uniref:Terminase small subunit n=1 Tax=Deminuibacter soli TaxID=2291815 RepID=A0A3E1NQ51_9BACT|nr:terminase small subunit [Deminuibacter soli]RFM30040.1 hypothetical protein DXN05_03450 [Deminuibacter soli]